MHKSYGKAKVAAPSRVTHRRCVDSRSLAFPPTGQLWTLGQSGVDSRSICQIVIQCKSMV
jgi:hypothetical protein